MIRRLNFLIEAFSHYELSKLIANGGNYENRMVAANIRNNNIEEQMKEMEYYLSNHCPILMINSYAEDENEAKGGCCFFNQGCCLI